MRVLKYCLQTSRLIDDKDKEVGYTHTTKSGTKYRRVYFKGKDHAVHRVIWEMINGKIPKDLCIDHIDGDGLNNKIQNLRLATRGQNAKNRKINKNNLSGYKGVTKAKGRNGSILKNPWRVYVQYNNKCYTKHGFPTPKAAAIHYNEKAIELFGEFARLNEV